MKIIVSITTGLFLVVFLFSAVLFNKNIVSSSEDSLPQKTNSFISSNPGAFITVWKTDNVGISNDNQIRFYGNGNLEYTWEEVDNSNNTGSGSTSMDEDSPTTISFPDPGTYRVAFTASEGGNPFNRMYFKGGSVDFFKLLEVEQWGNIVWSSFDYIFYSCKNMVITATDVPDLTNVTDMESAFGGINISNIPNLENWDVSNVTNMWNMFSHTPNFNQNIENWDVSNVSDMGLMFFGAESFNQPISNWDVSNVSNMRSMFEETQSFNQPIGNWNVGNVSSMAAMFKAAQSFNQPIGNWDVSNVGDMIAMFKDAQSFNQPIGNWDVSNVSGGMWLMFDGASSFNQDIGNWDVSNVSSFADIFSNASSFDQDLSSWELNSITPNSSFSFAFSGMSCENYSKTLQGWVNNPLLNQNITLQASGLEYSPDAVDDGDFMINQLGWNILGDSQGDCELSVESLDFVNFKFYPNPVQSHLYLSADKIIDNIRIYNISGQRIMEVQPNAPTTVLNTDALAPGIYLMEVEVNHNRKTYKVVKQ